MIRRTIEIFGPGITYQYSDDGWFDTSHGGGHRIDVAVADLAADASNLPALWQASFLASWGRSPRRSAESVLARLRELETDLLRRLPDNPCEQKGAWLVGVLEDCPDRVEIAARAARIREEVDAQARRDAERQAQLAALEAKVAVIERKADGKYSVQISTRHVVTGREWRFHVRDVMDVGVVINPLYPVAVDRPAGGISRINTDGIREWQAYVDGQGWMVTRVFDPDEEDAYRLVAMTHPFGSMPRMEDGGDVRMDRSMDDALP